MTVVKKKRIGIVGGGIGGLTAAWALSQKHTVTVLEKEMRLGGNAYSFTAKQGYAMDIAVAVFGKAGYPHFYGLLDRLNINTSLCPNSYMSLHNQDTAHGLYLTPSLKGAGAQRFDLLKPAIIKQLFNLFNGLRKLQVKSEKNELNGMSFGQALDGTFDLKGEARLILLCTLCLLSSMNVEDILKTPADFFLRKLRHHNDVISPKALYSVRCVDGGTKTYINRLTEEIRRNGSQVLQGTAIESVIRSDKLVEVETAEQIFEFDEIIFACNADQALHLLSDPTPLEKELLGVWQYNECDIVVHRDHSHFPARELIQAYTFIYSNKGGEIHTSVNGALWHESYVPKTSDYISSQYPNFPIREDLIDLKVKLRTPKFDDQSIKTIPRLRELNGKNRSWYCGSHFGFGLHNDAVESALTVAKGLGVDVNFDGPKKSPLRMMSGIRSAFKSPSW